MRGCQVVKLTLLYGIAALRAAYGERALDVDEMRNIVGANRACVRFSFACLYARLRTCRAQIDNLAGTANQKPLQSPGFARQAAALNPRLGVLLATLFGM